MKNSRRYGFSLLEITVVIGILGILVAGGMVGYSRQQAKARDARRMTDMEKLNIGVQSYLVDKRVLPVTSSYGTVNCYYAGRACPGGWDYSSEPTPATGNAEFMLFLRPYVDGTFPIDPINNGTGDVHYPSLGGQGYAYAYYYYTTCPDTSMGSCYNLQYKQEMTNSIFIPYRRIQVLTK